MLSVKLRKLTVNVYVILFFVVVVVAVVVRFWKGSDFSYLMLIRSQAIVNISEKEQLMNIPVQLIQLIPYFLVSCWDHDTSSDSDT